MKRNNPSLNDYEMVETLARFNSFRIAAVELALSPSALSRQLSLLESQLGVRLFDRDTRNVSITESGKEFIRAANKMLITSNEVIADFNSYLQARRGRLTIAGLPSVTGALLPKLLKDFATIHPGIDLRIKDALSDEVIEAVDHGASDLGFTAGTISARSRLSFIPLLEDNFKIVCRKEEFPMVSKEYSLAELVELPIILMAKGTSVRELFDAACQQAGVNFSPRFEVAHLATAGALVAEGLGITILPTLTLPIFRTEHLTFNDIRDFNINRRIGVVYRPGKSLSPAAQSFIEHVRKKINSLYQSIIQEYAN